MLLAGRQEATLFMSLSEEEPREQVKDGRKSTSRVSEREKGEMPCPVPKMFLFPIHCAAAEEPLGCFRPHIGLRGVSDFAGMYDFTTERCGKIDTLGLT